MDILTRVTMAILLVTLAAVSFALPVNSWYYPGQTPFDDELSNQFGPTTSSLLIIPYESQEAEYEAFKTGDIDFMDYALNATQLEELNALDPNMTTYTRTSFVDRGIRQIDINNMRFPTDDIQFRKALAHCFDKNTFVATQIAGLAMKMDSPLAWSTGWNNPYCTDLYPYNLTKAMAILDAAGYTDKDADGWREGPSGEEIILDFYIRQDDPDRTAMGTLMAINLESIGVEVNEQVAPRLTCFQKVMAEFDYHLYTGGWSVTTGIGPVIFDFNYLYFSDYAQTSPYASNYVGYSNPEFDFHLEKLLNANEMGDSSTPCTGKYHAYKCQEILMDDGAVIPIFTYASYGGYKAGWEKVVNEEGAGPWSWFTMLNTYKLGEDTICWGITKDIEALNVMHSNIGGGDWQILAKIYDRLLTIDPYNMACYKPWMAEEWLLGEWTFEGSPATWIEFKLREDMYWHDIAAKADRRTPNGTPLLVDGAYDEKVMADDVIFSICAIRDILDASYNQLVADVQYVEEIDPYTVRVYYSVHMPLWALLWVGDLPIMPKHVWESVFLESSTMEFDPLSQECLCGCGPWVFDYAGNVHNHYSLHANTRYFRYHPMDVIGKLEGYKIVEPCTTVNMTFYLHSQDFQRVIPPSEFLITITKTYPNKTSVVIYENSTPELLPCEEIQIFSYSEHIGRGFFTINVAITSDPMTGHHDMDGYPIEVWGTLAEDINLDFFVNIKDAVLLGVAFGTQSGEIKWNLAADINEDGFINPIDAGLIGAVFGWPG